MEFQVQGLALDWTIVTWDAGLRWRGSDWSYHSFCGTKCDTARYPRIHRGVYGDAMAGNHVRLSSLAVGQSTPQDIGRKRNS
jgi:hypothetical protein